MGIESGYVPAPFNGVSQAAAQIRQLEQAEALQDVFVDLPNGLRKRPPLVWVGQLLSSGGSIDAKAHRIKDPDDGSLKFILLNRASSVTSAYLFNSDASTVTLTTSAGAQTYLNTAIAPLKETSRIGQAIDYSVITSRNHTVTVDPSTVAARPKEALVFIKSGAFGKKYQCTITKAGGTPRVATVVTPDGTDASDSFWVATDVILNALFGANTYTSANGATATSIATVLGTDGFTTVFKGAVMYITHPTLDFTIAIQDDQGGVATSVAKGTVNNFTDLPDNGVQDGFTCQVLPTRGDKQGAYWVKFNATPSPGNWAETVGPGSQKGFLATDMPIGIVKDGSGNWQCEALPWLQRQVGDQTLSIDPLFVGNQIVDVGYSFGRILLLSNEEAFLCASDNPFRIYPATNTTVIDSDPTSLSPPSGDAKFRNATVFSSSIFEAAFLQGLQQQCILKPPADNKITPTNTKLNKVSKFTINELTAVVRPVENNSKVYMAIPLGTTYAGIRELEVQSFTGEITGNDLTAAVPKLLPQGFDIAATIESAYLSAYGVSGTSTFYIHFFRYDGGKRVQNGFIPQSLPVGWMLVDIVAEGTTLYFFLVNSAGRLILTGMETSPEVLDTEGLSSLYTHWDFRQNEDQIVSRAFDGTNTTIVSNVPLPAGIAYVSAQAPPLAVVQPYAEGYLAEVVSSTGSSIVIKGDWTAPQRLQMGLEYTGYWKPTRNYIVSQGDGRIVHGRLTLNRFTFDLSKSSAITAKVSIASRSVRSYDLKQITFGMPSVYTGQWVVPIKGEAPHTVVEIYLHGPLGALCSGYEWEADFVTKSKRTT